MIGLRGVVCLSAFAIRQTAKRGDPAIPVEHGNHAQPQQHPLHREQTGQIRLRETDAHALLLISLHRTVGVEESTQKAPVEFTRATFYRGCQDLLPWTHAHPGGQCCQSS